MTPENSGTFFDDGIPDTGRGARVDPANTGVPGCSNGSAVRPPCARRTRPRRRLLRDHGLQDWRDVIARLDVPFTMVAGRDSQLWPCSHAEAAVGDHALGRSVVIDDAGHATNFDRPDEFNGVLLAFVAGLEAGLAPHGRAPRPVQLLRCPAQPQQHLELERPLPPPGPEQPVERRQPLVDGVDVHAQRGRRRRRPPSLVEEHLERLQRGARPRRPPRRAPARVRARAWSCSSRRAGPAEQHGEDPEVVAPATARALPARPRAVRAPGRPGWPRRTRRGARPSRRRGRRVRRRAPPAPPQRASSSSVGRARPARAGRGAPRTRPARRARAPRRTAGPPGVALDHHDDVRPARVEARRRASVGGRRPGPARRG